MAEKLILTVFGATGGQGSGVVNTVLSNPILSKKFRLRGITRSIQSINSQNLVSKGIEMVVANMDDTASLERAVKGSHTVFAMTNFWEYFDGGRETQQGKNITNACLTNGVKHLIWSSAVDIVGLSQGRITGAAHIESKYDVQEYIETVKRGRMVATHVIPGVFMANLRESLVREIDDSNAIMRVAWGSGDDLKIPLIDSEVDTGTYVGAVLLKALESTNYVDGAEIQAVSEWSTPNEAVAVLSEVTGKTIRYQQCSLEDFMQNFPESLRVELGATTRQITDISFYGHESPAKQEHADRLLEGTGLKKTSLRQWAKRNSPLKFRKVK